MIEDSARSALLVDGGLRVELSAADRRRLDATGGHLDLTPSSLDVVSLTLVDLPRPPVEVARASGFRESGGFLHGVREGLLEREGGHWHVSLLTVGDTEPTSSRVDVGRLSDRDAERWGHLLGDTAYCVAVFVEATPGFAGIEVRFLRGVVDGTVPPASAVVLPAPEELEAMAPPPPPAGWYVDPDDESRYRWWDSATWTATTSPR